MRDSLLAGFSHILVDEYQDIDENQYELVSAIAGRSLEEDGRLAVLDPDAGWRDFAVLSRTCEALFAVRSVLGEAGYPLRTILDGRLPLQRVREVCFTFKGNTGRRRDAHGFS